MFKRLVCKITRSGSRYLKLTEQWWGGSHRPIPKDCGIMTTDFIYLNIDVLDLTNKTNGLGGGGRRRRRGGGWDQHSLTLWQPKRNGTLSILCDLKATKLGNKVKCIVSINQLRAQVDSIDFVSSSYWVTLQPSFFCFSFIFCVVAPPPPPILHIVLWPFFFLEGGDFFPLFLSLWPPRLIWISYSYLFAEGEKWKVCAALSAFLIRRIWIYEFPIWGWREGGRGDYIVIYSFDCRIV